MKPASYPESFLSSHSTSVLAFAVLRKQCVEDSSVWMPLCKRSAGLPPEPMEGGGSIPHFGSRSQRRPVFLNTGCLRLRLLISSLVPKTEQIGQGVLRRGLSENGALGNCICTSVSSIDRIKGLKPGSWSVLRGKTQRGP